MVRHVLFVTIILVITKQSQQAQRPPPPVSISGTAGPGVSWTIPELVVGGRSDSCVWLQLSPGAVSVRSLTASECSSQADLGCRHFELLLWDQVAVFTSGSRTRIIYFSLFFIIFSEVKLIKLFLECVPKLQSSWKCWIERRLKRKIPKRNLPSWETEDSSSECGTFKFETGTLSLEIALKV